MSFLEPLMLAALPLAALPIVIHLINQRRYQTMPWGAMQFLLEANRMSRGYARIRQWLILAARTLAVLGLVLAVSRPLASGRLGLGVGGGVDTAYVVLDRSPSMQQRGRERGTSKLERGLDQVAAALESVRATRIVLVDSVTLEPRELARAADVRVAPQTQPADASADLPALLQTVREHLENNRGGQAEIWICSDLRANDWQPESGLWRQLREQFAAFPQGVRFHLLAYPAAAEDDLAIRVFDVRRRAQGNQAELLVSLHATRATDGPAQSVPVRLEIDGAPSELELNLTGRDARLENYAISLPADAESGWGRVSLPADANAADNDFYFVFGTPPARRTGLVMERDAAARPLQLAAGISPDPAVSCAAEVVAHDQWATLAWEELALAIWQAPLPRGAAAAAVEQFVASGGQVWFLPPAEPDDASLWGVRWTAWQQPADVAAVANWRSDYDLLASTRSGAALPVGELRVAKFCGLEGNVVGLATLAGGTPLVARAADAPGGAYFVATTAAGQDSSLARDGVVLYAAVQRAVAAGAERLAAAQQRVAQGGAAAPGDWQRVAGPAERLSSEAPAHAGAYRVGPRWLAVNRDPAEDHARTLSNDEVDALFAGLTYDRVDDEADGATRLTREIWRALLVAMLLALVAEAALCLPTERRAAAGSLSPALRATS